MFFTPQHSYTYTLIHPRDSNRPGSKPTPACLLDVLPHRIHPKDGLAREDVVLAVLANMHTQHKHTWQLDGAKRWTNPRGPFGYHHHPLATIQGGAFTLHTDAETLEAAAHEGTPVVLDATHVTIGTTRHARATFHAPPYTPLEYTAKIHRITEVWADPATAPTAAFALGFVEAHIRLKAPPPLYDTLPPAIARFIAGKNGTRLALHAAMEVGTQITASLITSWLLRRTPTVHATHHHASPALDALMAEAQSHPRFATGQAAGAFLIRPTHSPRALAGLSTDGGTHHQELALRASIARLDALIHGGPHA